MNPSDLSFGPLSEADRAQVDGFSCGDEDYHEQISRFLIEDALWQQNAGLNATTLFFHDDELVGYTTLIASSLSLGSNRSLKSLFGLPKVSRALEIGRKIFPAVLIGYLATHKAFQNQHVASIMLAFAIAETVRSPIGARFIHIDVDRRNEEAQHFWSRKGFVFDEEANKSRHDLFGYLDLYYDINPGA